MLPILVVFTLLTLSSAFVVPGRRLFRPAPSLSVPIEILGRDIQGESDTSIPPLHGLMSSVAPDVRSKVEIKVGKALEKLGQFATSCHVTLKVVKNPDGEHHKSMKPDSHISEVSVFMKGGSVVKVSESAENMETAGELAHNVLLAWVPYPNLFSRSCGAHPHRELEEIQREEN